MARQATVVAFYGSKPAGLAELVARCQDELAGELGAGFRPYQAGQVHATLVGLERVPGSPRLNRAFSTFRGRSVAMDIPRALAELAHELRMPMTLRFAGFGPEEQPFTSRGRRPHDRSFSLQDDRAVLMGWPVRRSPIPGVPWAYPPVLDGLRRRVQKHGVLHAWHASPDDVDNDVYLRLGLLRRDVDTASRVAAEDRLRTVLADHEPVTVGLTADGLHVVSYTDDTLPPSSSVARPVRSVWTDAEVDALYA